MLFQTGCGVPVAAIDVRCYAADESEKEYPFNKYERIMGNAIGNSVSTLVTLALFGM